jgi:hypothetical protein
MDRDYSNDWMPEPFLSEFDKGYLATIMSSNIEFTFFGGWKLGSLGYRYNAESRGDLNPPKTWPIYRLNRLFQVRTGERAPRGGIYLPDADESCPQFIRARYPAHEANIGLNESGQQERCTGPALWTLVERAADEGGEVPIKEEWRSDPQLFLYRDGGQPCPRAGWWWTPANTKARRHFALGEIMPDVPSTTHGATLWHWDQKQSE